MTRTHHRPPLSFETLDDVVEALRAEGGRHTTPRRLVLETLFDADAPVSAETIAGQLKLELTSVYRNLETLEALGVVRHVHLGHGPGLYALRGRGAREYLVCERCDKVTAVEPAELDEIRAAIRARFGFEAAFGHFPISGLCADCRDDSGLPVGDAPVVGRHAHGHDHA